MPPGWASGNWSGYALNKSKRGSCRDISGYWIVPLVKPSRTNTYSSAWIGIDGFGNSSLIQTGTEHDYVNGKTLYYAWWEILPAPETRIRFRVSPFDLMYARITKLGSNKWRILLANKTHGWVFKKVTTYNGPATTAEWIMEAPSLNGRTTRLANYKTILFKKCRLNRKNPLLQSSDRGIMIQRGKIVSTPSLPNQRRSSFFVAYGSRMPNPPK
ncbi:hypothetical protein H8B09_30060 [Paenibacillus sp. PR3]|uniref:Peptidase A4 family protein n=1 Tax=Paenibacillus terricola TaxID=2763503 RepID=A0ABR8N478_9BACL|nr:hypothetical protein [Paenibacillus terricola]